MMLDKWKSTVGIYLFVLSKKCKLFLYLIFFILDLSVNNKMYGTSLREDRSGSNSSTWRSYTGISLVKYLYFFVNLNPFKISPLPEAIC